jgi:hypothetical protein
MIIEIKAFDFDLIKALWKMKLIKITIKKWNKNGTEEWE